eukprot:TRINITY_DN2749_c0_g2_i1.p1 TRINITY_DN2749_c0_g2~~TRINITY_DN2749_c0_g2_i1.p1  ORF type:complete len:826 (-),score=182.05 TRINITY_DN2749_c0_g2_i1:147-2624(-)
MLRIIILSFCLVFLESVTWAKCINSGTFLECSGHGSCDKYSGSCNCEEDSIWFGDQCQFVSFCENNSDYRLNLESECIDCDRKAKCNENGVCDATGSCLCNLEWGGTFCEKHIGILTEFFGVNAPNVVALEEIRADGRNIIKGSTASGGICQFYCLDVGSSIESYKMDVSCSQLDWTCGELKNDEADSDNAGPSDKITTGALNVDVSSLFLRLNNLKTVIFELCSNGKNIIHRDGIALIGSDKVANVFDINVMDLINTQFIGLSVPPQSTVVIRVNSKFNFESKISVANIQFHGDFAIGTIESVAERVIWVFDESVKDLEIRNVDWIGSILAPMSDVSFAEGSVFGQIGSKSLHLKNMSIEYVTFKGLIPWSLHVKSDGTCMENDNADENLCDHDHGIIDENGECVCHDANLFGGSHCSVESSKLCGSHGTLKCLKYNAFGVCTHSSEECVCDADFANSVFYTGEHCEQEVLCEKGSVKVDKMTEEIICKCFPWAIGVDCSEDVICVNGRPNEKGLCDCTPGWIGKLCDKLGFEDIDTTITDLDNYGDDMISKCDHGSITNGICFCDHGYTGVYCDTPFCVHGEQQPDKTCICEESWFGESCEKHCRGHCGWKGTYCHNSTPQEDKCMCLDGFFGDHCEEIHLLPNQQSQLAGVPYDVLLARLETSYDQQINDNEIEEAIISYSTEHCEEDKICFPFVANVDSEVELFVSPGNVIETELLGLGASFEVLSLSEDPSTCESSASLVQGGDVIVRLCEKGKYFIELKEVCMGNLCESGSSVGAVFDDLPNFTLSSELNAAPIGSLSNWIIAGSILAIFNLLMLGRVR